jgi:hypothetical protein
MQQKTERFLLNDACTVTRGRQTRQDFVHLCSRDFSSYRKSEGQQIVLADFVLEPIENPFGPRV